MNSLLANLPIIRAYRHDSVPYHTGSILGNRLGLQVFRTASQNLQYRLRGWSGSGSNDNCVKEVAKNGIAVIENFLDPEEFARVRTEFEEAFKNVQPQPYKGGTNARLYRMQVPLPDAPHTYSKLRENFQRSQRLNSIASAVVRRKTSGPPESPIRLVSE